MHILTSAQIIPHLASAGVKPRLRRELRFKLDDITNWSDYDFISVNTRSLNEGILVIELDIKLYILPYTITRKLTDVRSGRGQPITCDFCYTWQAGSNAARISFARGDTGAHSFLCCADLRCSLHARNLTPESLVSKSQLRENIAPEQKMLRLQQRLRWLVTTLDAPAFPIT